MHVLCSSPSCIIILLCVVLIRPNHCPLSANDCPQEKEELEAVRAEQEAAEQAEFDKWREFAFHDDGKNGGTGRAAAAVAGAPAALCLRNAALSRTLIPPATFFTFLSQCMSPLSCFCACRKDLMSVDAGGTVEEALQVESQGLLGEFVSYIQARPYRPSCSAGGWASSEEQCSSVCRPGVSE